MFFIHDHVTGATKIEEYVPEIRPNISGTEKLRSEWYPVTNTTTEMISIVLIVVIEVLIERVSDCVQLMLILSLSVVFGKSERFSLILS